MSDKINRCGCGGEGIPNKAVIPSCAGAWTVFCGTCGCNSNYNLTKKKAIERWNTAHPDQAEQVKALLKAQEEDK